jgi:transposase-like protein
MGLITLAQLRRGWATEEKIQIVRMSMDPGMSGSLVAREAGSIQSAIHLETAVAGRSSVRRWL